MSTLPHTNPFLFQPSQLAAALSRLLSAAGNIEFPAEAVNDATHALAQHQLAISDRFVLRDADNNDTVDTAAALTCYDRQTNLTWQRVSSADRYEHADAITHAASLDFAGFKDWRLPTILELESIRDLSVFSPAVAAPFRQGVRPNWHWSSSLVPEVVDYARGVYFLNGYSYLYDRGFEAFVLAVRGGAGAVVGALPGQ